MVQFQLLEGIPDIQFTLNLKRNFMLLQQYQGYSALVYKATHFDRSVFIYQTTWLPFPKSQC